VISLILDVGTPPWSCWAYETLKKKKNVIK
jgi:hypothetical protein